MYPETAKIQETIAKTALERSQNPEIPESVQKEYVSNLRANLGSNIGSPIAADYTSRGLANMEEDWKRYYTELAANMAGRLPLVQPPTYGQQYGGMTPGGVMSTQMQGYGSWVMASRPFAYNLPTKGQSPMWGLASKAIGGLFGGGGGGGFGF